MVAVLDEAAAAAVRRLPSREPEIRLLRDLALGRHGRGPPQGRVLRTVPADDRPGDRQGRRGHRELPLVPALRAQRGRRAPGPVRRRSDEFHHWAADRLQSWPDTLNAMSTHDTKRSEDVRARLAALSEIPTDWASAVRGWRQAVGPLEPSGGAAGGDADAATEWLLWQTVVGAWPIDADRLSGYLVKAAREAKLRTSWTNPQPGYEASVAGYVHAVLRGRTSVVGGIGRVRRAAAAGLRGQRARPAGDPAADARACPTSTRAARPST